jgi:hypothetical protein
VPFSSVRSTCPSYLIDFIILLIRVQIMKLLIMQVSPSSCYFLLIRSKYSPHHPVLGHPQSVFSPLTRNIGSTLNLNVLICLHVIPVK